MNYGYGKFILFGEHFVVHGVPSIAGPVGKTTIATIEKGVTAGIEIVDNRQATPGYKELYKEIQADANKRIAAKLGVDTEKNPVKVTLAGDLYCASGIGASAASCVAIARALGEYFNLNLTDEQVNDAAFEGEKAYAGNPSGIDNTVSTFGKLVFFRKEPRTMEQLKITKPFTIIMANTGLTTKTKEAVAAVATAKEKEPEKFNAIFAEAEALVLEARKALEQGKDIGMLMNDNHALLQKIGVSCKELDTLVEAARNAGAIGAKMTGGGRGGYMLALVEEKDAEKIEQALKDAGAVSTIITKVEK